MIMHVYERARKANKLDRVIIAVDAQETIEALKDFDAEIIMTSTKHQSGTDRIAEAIADIETDIVINIQGDEPLLDPKMIDDLVSLFDDKTVKIATLASTKITKDDLKNPNLVKVTVDADHNAEWFYRDISDYSKKYFHHIGIYGYRKSVLESFTNLKQSDNEKNLFLEQLRALDNGLQIRVAICDFPHRGIDIPEDLKQLEL